MKIKGSIEIKKPQALVAKLFADPNYLKEYQDGFVKKELVSGQMGKASAVSKMYYKHGKYDMELTETILVNRLPDYFEANYQHIHMDNSMKCTLVEIDKEKTRFEYEVEYTRIAWVIPKLISILFPSMFRKQMEKWMRQFKVFVEKYDEAN